LTDRVALTGNTSGARGMRQVLRCQLETALAEMPGRGASDEEIHEARKRLKAARATLRLLRPLLSEAGYRHENRALRDAARSLSAARDATVLVSTLGELAQQAKGARERLGLAALASRLRRDASRTRNELARGGLRKSAGAVRTALGALDNWRAPASGWKPVRKALRTTYRQGRRCARASARRDDGATLHEWRKRAKYLRSQLEVIAPVQHATIAALSRKLHELSDHLGDEHDLAVLSDLAQRHGREIGRGAGGALQKVIASKRRKLRQRALEVGLPLYAEKPRHFAARLRRYFQEWP